MGRGIFGGFVFPVYSYLIDELLIDTGAPVAQKEFKRALEKLPVSVVVNTHSHEDHIGNNAMVARLKGAQILVHPSGLPILSNPKLLHLRFYQRFAWGTPAPSAGNPVPPEIQTGTHQFTVIETPGHSPDHICLYEPTEGWLFSGDLHIAELTLVYQPFDDFHQILDSLKKLLPLDIHEIFDAHKGHISDGMDALNAKIQFMETTKVKVTDLFDKGMSPKEITFKVLGKEEIFAKITRGHMSKLNGVKSILRLDKPEAEKS